MSPELPEQTRWSTVRDLSEPDDPEAWQAAWTYLHTRYRAVMVRQAERFLTRGLGKTAGVNEAEDAVSAFLLACVEKGWLARADPKLGRFRVFVYVLLARFTKDWIGRARAARRRPADGRVASLEDGIPEAAAPAAQAGADPYDEGWAACMLEAAMDRVAVRSEGNAVLLRLLLAAPDAPASLVADQIGCRTAQVPVRTLRARRMLAEELWSELQQTVSSRAEMDEEYTALAPHLAHHLDPDTHPSFYGPADAGPATDGDATAQPEPPR